MGERLTEKKEIGWNIERKRLVDSLIEFDLKGGKGTSGITGADDQSTPHAPLPHERSAKHHQCIGDVDADTGH
jgi:hypothetical protein